QLLIESPSAQDLASLLSPWGVPLSLSQPLYEKTARAYASPERVYHTLAHVGQVLKTIDALLPSISAPLSTNDLFALKLAAWFHDVVYDPRQNDNEEQSAIWMAQATEHLNLPVSLLTISTHIILATRKHEANSDDHAQILLDADLAILGAESAVYEGYAAAIRQEFGFVPEAAYRVGRAAVLARFLARERIYFTAQGYEWWETSARENLKREISSLQNPSL
ncbi:MAG TPA: hypothetical protein PK530_24980, partial [Anaerolineales bacterium]|nr:hypothetical protein [Anaerolineales bacterium]